MYYWFNLIEEKKGKMKSSTADLDMRDRFPKMSNTRESVELEMKTLQVTNPELYFRIHYCKEARKGQKWVVQTRRSLKEEWMCLHN